MLKCKFEKLPTLYFFNYMAIGLVIIQFKATIDLTINIRHINYIFLEGM